MCNIYSHNYLMKYFTYSGEMERGRSWELNWPGCPAKMASSRFNEKPHVKNWDGEKLRSPGQCLTKRRVKAGGNSQAGIWWVYDYLMCMYVCVTYACLVCTDIRRRHLISWNRSWRWLWVASWVMGIKFEFSGRVASALNHWALSPAPRECYVGRGYR